MMIQDIAPRTFYNPFRDVPVEGEDYILAFSDGRILTKEGEDLEFIRYRELPFSDGGSFLPGGRETARRETDTKSGKVTGDPTAQRETDTKSGRVAGDPTARQGADASGDGTPPMGDGAFQYLFSIDGQRYFLAMRENVAMQGDITARKDISMPENVAAREDIAAQKDIAAGEDIAVPDGCIWRSMYDVRACAPKYQVMAAATAWHLYVWYRDNRFCGRCGAPTVHSKTERARICPACGNTIYPKIAPAVIVAVTDGEKILLTKYAHRRYTRYALIAGFTEIGETVEETVKREVLEEVGIHVKNIRYYKSQPWGFDSNVLMGFFAEPDETKIRMDREELAVAEWVDRADVPDYGENLSLTHEMMRVFKERRNP